MKIDQGLLKRLGQFTRHTSLVVMVALGLPATAGAADVTVDCDGPGPADFGSISAALTALSLEGPNTIFVLPGTCVENIDLNSRERLTIDAPDGNVNIVAADPDRAVILIWGSRSISLRTLAVDNSNRSGIAIFTSSEVRLEGTHSNSNRNGYSVNDHSSVYFSAHATENEGAGLVVARGSLAFVEAATLTGNGGTGIECRDGSTCQLDGNVVIENNGGAGLAAVNTSLVRVVSNTGPNSVQSNASGIFLTGNSRAVLTGPNGNSVTANNGPGIQLDQNSTLSLVSGTVSNNAGPGVSVLRNSAAGIGDAFGLNTIGNNVGANLACDGTSLLHGNLNRISRIDCHRIERAMGPPRPGTVN